MDISRSRSSEALRKVVTPGGTPNSTLRLVVPPQLSPSWRRSRSLSDTEKTLDDAIRELDSLQVNISDDLEVARRHRHYSSNDSAMGESELIMSPAPSASSEPSTLSRARNITRNRSDSAFSNNTSPTNSSNEGMSTSEMMSTESDASIVHHRNASTLSSTSEPDRQLTDSGPTLRVGSDRPTSDSVSLPTFSPERELEGDVSLQSHDPSVPAHVTRASSLKTVSAVGEKSKQNRKFKLKSMPSVTSSGTYSPSRSPVLKSKGPLQFSSSEVIHESSTDSSANPTPTPPIAPHTLNQTSEALTTANESNSSFLSDEGTVI